MVLLKVNKSTHEDIEARITRLGPIYKADFFMYTQEHGLIINLGEVGLVVEEERTRNGPEVARPRKKGSS